MLVQSVLFAIGSSLFYESFSINSNWWCANSENYSGFISLVLASWFICPEHRLFMIFQPAASLKWLSGYPLGPFILLGWYYLFLSFFATHLHDHCSVSFQVGQFFALVFGFLHLYSWGLPICAWFIFQIRCFSSWTLRFFGKASSTCSCLTPFWYNFYMAIP